MLPLPSQREESIYRYSFIQSKFRYMPVTKYTSLLLVSFCHPCASSPFAILTKLTTPTLSDTPTMSSCVVCWRDKAVVTAPIYNDAYLAVCVASSLLLNLYCELVWFKQSRSRVAHARARPCAPLIVGLQMVVVC